MFDLDSGGKKEQFLHSLISLYNRGVSAVVIEDKVGEKTNSLAVNCCLQKQDTVENFSEKIRCGRNLIRDDDFMIIARIESLVLGKGVDDGIHRAEKYIKANADAILIHYNKCDTNLIKKFCEEYKKIPNAKPLAVVPTAYSYVDEQQLKSWGVNIVIYANHITRSIVPSVLDTGSKILENGRALEASINCISVSETLNLINDSRDYSF